MDETGFHLLKALLDASDAPDATLLGSLICAVNAVIPAKTCSLWKINERAQHTSVKARELSKPLPVPIPPEDIGDYVHPIADSLIGRILTEIKNTTKLYVDIPDVQAEQYLKLHSSKLKVIDFGMKRLLSIPIPNYARFAHF